MRGEVARFGEAVVAVEDGTGGHGAKAASQAVGEEDETCFEVGESEAGVEEGGGGRGDHGSDGVDDGTEKEGTGDVLFGEEDEGHKKAADCKLT